MRFHPNGAHLALLLFAVATPATLAQENRGSANGVYRETGKDPHRQQKAIVSRLLTLSDGLAILGAALDSRNRADFPSDCSHLVHELYGRAGFPYEYASSWDLYAGIDEFRQVASPQPGDLAVWTGHAGIVINPTQHSFLSVLSSGPGVDSYDSVYWKQRGRPRFFRYVNGVPSGILSTARRTVSLKSTVLGNTEPHDTAAENPVLDVLGESSSESENGTSSRAENQPMNAITLRLPVVSSARPKPDQVGAAFLQACNDWEGTHRGRDLFKSAQSLVVFDHFEVKKVHAIGNQGWVEVQINELVSLTGSTADVNQRSERQRWPLSRRDNKSWELTPSRNTIYLPQHIAERVLARELAQLTEDSANIENRAPEKAQLARLLDVLLEK
jgi:hypothetical protein